MSSKWTSQTLPNSDLRPADEDLHKFVVLLLYGKNSFGDKIYSYVKITIGNLVNMRDAIKGGQGFNPSDFGEVIAAGKGEPTSEVKGEVAAMYQVLDSKHNSQPPTAANAPQEKKNWDEY